ncbi:arrestin domain-containing protein 3-like [Anabas testudineus]|uniref:arrestin domain-containing protein 3-like n=1 Tax=Anabas testudineus TaxID=64144 RepID=UPI000E4600A4|nr:arrestin domain-containing protein 3-like [Anabas testudineus]
MASSVKSIKVTYNSINEKNSFTHGDWISGQVTVDVAKDCQIDSLFVKIKAKADVFWTERLFNRTHVYTAKEKYLSFKYYFIRDKNLKDDNKQTLLRNQQGETYSSVVAPGCHVYPFAIQIPYINLPSSFRGSYGKIVHVLQASLGRSMRVTKKDSAYFNFVSRTDLNAPWLMTPQHGSKDKKMKVFSSGTVSMDVNIEKTGFLQGEGIKVFANIQNNSSREIKPKYCLYTEHIFVAGGEKTVNNYDVFKEVGEPIAPSTEQKVTRVITIPNTVEPSLLNSNLIKVEYGLKVYLDVKLASDPEIKFPIVILWASQVSAAAPQPVPTGFGFDTFRPPVPQVWGVVPPAAAAQPLAPPPAAAQPLAPPLAPPPASAPPLAPALAPAAPQPFDPPPPYEAQGMYPPLEKFDNKYQ